MERMSVRSSNLKSVGYNAVSRLLEIEFRDLSIYQYVGVSLEVYRTLMSAASHGTFFHAHIRDKFPTRKIR